MSKNDFPKLMNKSSYARRLGRSPAAVSKWIARGALTWPALRPDGLIDVELADQQIALSVDLSVGRTPSRIAET